METKTITATRTLSRRDLIARLNLLERKLAAATDLQQRALLASQYRAVAADLESQALEDYAAHLYDR